MFLVGGTTDATVGGTVGALEVAPFLLIAVPGLLDPFIVIVIGVTRVRMRFVGRVVVGGSVLSNGLLRRSSGLCLARLLQACLTAVCQGASATHVDCDSAELPN